ncbi:MAG: aminomethyl-transferring glycine dehydrogenase [Ignavibacteriae bacterium]|nr:aminomethyl-transferring glycine dehydrogenase [Ignavibacteriota bacterium]
MDNILSFEKFSSRHNGPSEKDVQEMLKIIGVNTLDELINETVPADIRLDKSLELEEPMSEFQFLKKLNAIAEKNRIFKSYIGMGYYDTILPSVIRKNVFENPGWYTQYTPYQAEISQGRLEALLNYQTMIIDLTGLPIANASLLDEATAAAEAMHLCYAQRKGDKAKSNTIFVSDECFPQTVDVIKTRAVPHGINVQVGNYKTLELTNDLFAVVVQYPALNGDVYDYTEFFENASKLKINTIICADLLSLALLKTPAEMGADIAVGSTQRFGIPMGFGGPHAAYFATKEDFKRNLPGRIIGVSIDAQNNKAYRMALQTREQHIRREKATSNICTSQVLLAIMAGMYAVYHGPDGIQKIATRINALTHILFESFKSLGYKVMNNNYFDTVTVEIENEKVDDVRKLAEGLGVNFRYIGNRLSVSLDETSSLEDLALILAIFDLNKQLKLNEINFDLYIPENLTRKSAYLTHPVFNKYHCELDMMRYIKSLENKDLSLTGSMIPLGSCTMKLNAATEIYAIGYPGFSGIHPFAPADQTEGYKEMIDSFNKDICEITGFKGVSIQPNSGAQGEYTGLMVIRQYHISSGENQRDIALIPCSAHGTNPASAVMAGMKVVVVDCDPYGNIDTEDLKRKAEQYKDTLSALMVTYPSTHGVFEENIIEICNFVHKCGGLVYMDGANMNAQVGLTSPAKIGADVCHLNLHKTFAIPHGGGGPGVGPIAVAEHLVKFLPGHSVVNIGNEDSISAVSAAPFGSVSVLPISFAYIKMMGAEGLTNATKIAILNANYVKDRLKDYFKALYTGSKGRVAHELIFDVREFKNTAHIDVIDIAKRLMDYGFHAPTVSFPVAGTLMFEPTESESKFELDRFCEAMISIRKEIEAIEKGEMSETDNPLKNAPHTSKVVTASEWNHPYTREQAAFPVEGLKNNKFWPSVSRINDAYGDRNLVCSCGSVEDYRV